MSKTMKTAIVAAAMYANHKANFKFGQALIIRELVLSLFKK